MFNFGSVETFPLIREGRVEQEARKSFTANAVMFTSVVNAACY